MTEWRHPRRATKETISYLLQIEPVLDKFDEGRPGHGHWGGAGDEGGGDDDDDDVGREQMLDNVLEELKHQTASIMEDRKGSVVAEKIARRLTPVQLRVVLSRCRGYMASLANNRYSSHVLQTLLSFAGDVVEQELSVGDEDEAGFVIDTEGDHAEKPDPLQDILISLVSELKGTWAELMENISGSHVGRAFLQVLGGLPILTEQRGKQARHAHSIEDAVSLGAMARAKSTDAPSSSSSSTNPASPSPDADALEKWSTPHIYRVPASFEAALGDTVSELQALPVRTLQGLVSGAFGCPLVVMMLRVYANKAVTPGSGRLPSLKSDSPAMELAAKVLEWKDEASSSEVVYAMSGESTASYFLEAMIWLSPTSFLEEMYRRCFEDR